MEFSPYLSLSSPWSFIVYKAPFSPREGDKQEKTEAHRAIQGLAPEMDAIDPKVVLGFWGLGHRVEGHGDRGHTQAWLPGKRQATTCHCHSLY